MNAKMMKTVDVNVKYIQLEVAVRYEEEDIPNDFPLRENDTWKATIDIDTGIILDWPQGKTGDFCMKICDEGTYRLLDENKNVLVEKENDYVPNRLLPGEYGDYLELKINPIGAIENWMKNPSLDDFEEYFVQEY